MSVAYDLYLEEHKSNVAKGFRWLENHLPWLMELCRRETDADLEQQICFAHDISKNKTDEYAAYDAYFYGNNRSYAVTEDFNRAWLLHIHRNPHHWQHWVLINDDPDEGEIVMEMPLNHIIEMICDWWAFSWKAGNLYEIFNWYDEHRDYIKLNSATRWQVEKILAEIKMVLDNDSMGV